MPFFLYLFKTTKRIRIGSLLVTIFIQILHYILICICFIIRQFVDRNFPPTYAKIKNSRMNFSSNEKYGLNKVPRHASRYFV